MYQIYGRYPFDSKERDYARKFHNAEYPLPPEVPASDSCKDLLKRLLRCQPRGAYRYGRHHETPLVPGGPLLNPKPQVNLHQPWSMLTHTPEQPGSFSIHADAQVVT